MSFFNRFLEDRPRDTELLSVIRNLNRMLGARRGYASRLAEYGVTGEYGPTSAQDATNRLMAEILSTLRSHEPRLVPRDITALGRDPDLIMHLRLRGRLSGREVELPIDFHMAQGWLKVCLPPELSRARP